MLKVQIRPVWRFNADYEFALIRHYSRHCRFVSLDTEFPRVVYKSGTHPRNISPEERYSILKKNVDLLKIIQIGLTLSDPKTMISITWEFNFRDFDVLRDPCTIESIKLLHAQGIGFRQNRIWGIDTRHFANLMWTASGLLANKNLMWITFHGSADFAYLMKIVAPSGLPDSIEGFSTLLEVYFGKKILDLKYMMNFCENLYGGLEKVGAALNVERIGMSHQAGSDSLLTWHVYQKMVQNYFRIDEGTRFSGVLFGWHTNEFVRVERKMV